MRKLCHSCGWLLPVLILFCSGCAMFSKVGNYDVLIRRNPEFKDIAIQVDVIGVPKEDKDTWAATDVNKYWARVLEGRRDPNTLTLQFGPGQQKDQLLKASSKTEINRKYKVLLETKRPWYLAIISDYPSALDDKDAGANDPRRCLVPLARSEYGMWTRQITVEIQKNGIRTVAP